MDIVEVFDNRERLREHFAAGQLECGHSRLRIDAAILRSVLASALLDEVDRHRLIRKPLEIERDADPIRGGGTKIRIEFHGLTPACIATI